MGWPGLSRNGVREGTHVRLKFVSPSSKLIFGLSGTFLFGVRFTRQFNFAPVI